MILLKAVPDPERFGVAQVEGDRVTRIVEKPSEPPTDLAVTGCYFYDRRVFDIIGGLSPSARGELEITDVNNQYVDWGQMSHRVLDGWWTDAGTIASLHRAGNLVAEAEDNPVLRHAIGGTGAAGASGSGPR
jgi:glucose-1-phosphate thymidylyltransferase